MNILKIAESTTSLFPKKTIITLQHAITGIVLGIYKLPSNSLPETFDKPITLNITGISWRILKTELVKMENFTSPRKLLLQVQEATVYDKCTPYYQVPTQAFPQPSANNLAKFNDFTLSLTSTDWRQLELLPLSLLSLIREEITCIESTLAISPQNNPLLGYEHLHIRERIGDSHLDILLSEFYTQVCAEAIGNLQLETSNYISNAFALKSPFYTWYGQLRNDSIINLCISQFDCADDLLINILDRYDLVLVNWFRAVIIMAGDVP